MAKLLKRLDPDISKYRDRRFEGSQEEFEECLRSSSTLYIGNLSFFTAEEQIWEVFSKVGDVKRIVMGLDKQKHTPCGFCFVIYYTRGDAENAVKYVNGSLLDERPIRVDFDWGFQEGRQFGRGRSGGQVRDEWRRDYDPGRGGYGKVVLQEMETTQGQMYAEGLADDQPRPRKRARGAVEEPVVEDAAVAEEEPRGARYQHESEDEDED